MQLVSKKALLMALHSEDMRRLARLARLDLPEEAQTALAGQLNTFFGLVEQMNAVDTDGLEPLAHPDCVPMWRVSPRRRRYVPPTSAAPQPLNAGCTLFPK